MTLVHVEAVSNGYSYNSDGGETSLVTAVNLTGGGRIVLTSEGHTDADTIASDPL